MVTSKARRTVWILAGLLAAALSGLTAARYRRDSSGAIERGSTGSQIAETRCGPIEYAVAGEGPPVLVVHGAGGGCDQGLEFAEPLIRSGFRVIAMSRFGYLRTPLPSDASPAAQADAYACLLDALSVTEVALAGASAGGPSSMQFALRHPERITAPVLVVDTRGLAEERLRGGRLRVHVVLGEEPDAHHPRALLARHGLPRRGNEDGTDLEESGRLRARRS